MTLSDFLSALNSAPDTIAFTDTMAVIEANYVFTETAFKNGTVDNGAGQNSGSCKIFAFGKLNALTQAQTLACFGNYFRKDVLENPAGDDHGNIRNFIVTGWGGVVLEGEPLSAKEE